MDDFVLAIPNGIWIFGLVLLSFWSGIIFSNSPDNKDRLKARVISAYFLIFFVFMVIATYPTIAG